MKLRIPQSRRWSGPYLGNYYGDLWKTFNIDLDREEGKICLSKRMDTVADTTDTNSDTLTLATAFLRANSDCVDRYWALCDSGILLNVDSSPTGDWKTDALANSPDRCHDFTIFENDTRGDSASKQQLFVTTDSEIYVLNDTGANTWTNNWWTVVQGNPSLDTGVYHPISYFPFQRIVLVGSGNRIHTISRINSSSNESSSLSRLVLPSDLRVIHIFYTSNRAWILCANTKGGNGRVVEWDGFSQSPNGIHDAYAAIPMSGVNWNEIPIVINSKGIILEFTGNGFRQMIRNGEKVSMPISQEPYNDFSFSSNSFIGSVKPHGMVVGEDGLIYINASNPRNASYRQGAGIWCLNPITGRLYNKYTTGQWSSGNTDFGQQRFDLGSVGGLHPIPSTSGRSLLIGGRVDVNYGNTAKNAIWAMALDNDTTVLRGYFITGIIPAEDISNFWDLLYAVFKKFFTSGNKIIVKAKGQNSLYGTPTYLPLESSITWTGASTFTVQLSAADTPIQVGDEVEVIGGDNAGTLSHISTISGAHAAVQTITIDETLTASANTARVRFDRWKKLGVISDTNKSFSSVKVGIDSTYIQYKIEMRGPSAEMEISSLLLTSEPSTKVE